MQTAQLSLNFVKGGTDAVLAGKSKIDCSKAIEESILRPSSIVTAVVGRQLFKKLGSHLEKGFVSNMTFCDC